WRWVRTKRRWTSTRSTATNVVIGGRARDFWLISFDFFGGGVLAMSGSMSGALRFVYIIRGRKDPSRFYTGVTAEVNARIATHNAGRSPHTSRLTPWERVVSIA